MFRCGGNVFQEEGTSSAKVLRSTGPLDGVKEKKPMGQARREAGTACQIIWDCSLGKELESFSRCNRNSLKGSGQRNGLTRHDLYSSTWAADTENEFRMWQLIQDFNVTKSKDSSSYSHLFFFYGAFFNPELLWIF